MKTLLLDKSSPQRRVQTPGGLLQEEKVKHSETGATMSAKNGHTLVKVHIEEDTIDAECEQFYKKNDASLVPTSDDGDSASTVRTSEHDEPVLKERNDLETFCREKLTLNERNFHINEVLGNFPIDKFGQIINRKETIWKNHFRDLDDQLVNERGYLINEKTGAIRSRYTFEDLFMPVTSLESDLGELPMPFRMERWNFNPHRILGNFDFDA